MNRKTILTCTLALLVASSLNAQTNPGDTLRTMYRVYTAPEIKDSPAPRGYEPVYISHYGRHGSRYHMAANMIAPFRDSLLAAEKRGALTEPGKKALKLLVDVYDLSDDLWGELTPLGAEEHKGIAGRMVARYPEVFKGRKRIDAYSSIRTRCTSSMAAAAATIAAGHPELDFRFYCGKKYLIILKNEDYLPEAKKWYGPKIEERTLAERDWKEILTRLISDNTLDNYASMLIVRNIWMAWAGAPILGLEGDFDIFEWMSLEEVADMSRWQDMNLCMQGLRTDRFGDIRIKSQTALLQDIITRADEALADRRVAATLRFGHDANIVPLMGLLNAEGFSDTYVLGNEPAPHWNSSKMVSMGSNLQMVFYRHPKKDTVLVKLVYNEKETRISGLKSVSGPYYDWEELKRFISAFTLGAR